MPAARAYPITTASTVDVFTGRGLFYGVNVSGTAAAAGDILVNAFDGGTGGIQLLRAHCSPETDAGAILHPDRRMFVFPLRPVEVERKLTVQVSVVTATLDMVIVYFNTEVRLAEDLAMFTDKTADWSIQEVAAVARFLGG